ncbi:MAG: Hsp20/alpha crystallin family protein [Phycisphaerales bacterium]|nr:MAG: Hsp20/alpha crystallin family protein [Phycisphaerales bacterium]
MRIKLQSDSEDFDQLSRKMSFMIEELQHRSFHAFSARQGWKPAVNLYEGKDEFIICVDLAGMKPAQIDVHTEGNTMVIRGDRPMPHQEGGGGRMSVHQMEIDWGPFERQIEIPEGVDLDGISANYKDGFLWVVLPGRISRRSPAP